MSINFVQPCPPSPFEPNTLPVTRHARDTERVIVNKDTQRIRFENETEHQVTVVIEPKEKQPSASHS